MNHQVYILFSKSIDKYYTGETHDIEQRLERHNSKYYDNKWTARGIPWELYLIINCANRKQAILVERHIKKMKSRKYIENLKKYPEMVERLKERYN